MLDALFCHPAGEQSGNERGLRLGIGRIELHRLFKQIDAALVVT